MGYEDFGKLYILKLGSQYLFYASEGCQPFQFHVQEITERQQSFTTSVPSVITVAKNLKDS